MADATIGPRFGPGPRYRMIDVRVDQAALDRVSARIRHLPGAVARIMPPALNASASEMRTVLYRAFTSRMELRRKSSVKDRLTLTPKASRGKWASGVRISLARFTIGSFKDVQQTPSGVTWSAGGSNLRGGFIPRAFLREGLTHYRTGEYIQGRQVWKRKEEGGRMVPRYPIQLLRGPSLAKVFSDDAAFQSDMERQATAIVEKKLHQQVERILATQTVSQKAAG